MGEYSYQLYIRWGDEFVAQDCTVNCKGDDQRDDLVAHFKNMPNILSICTNRLEDVGLWIPQPEA